MEFSKFFGFLEILKESIKIMPRNGRLMVIITSLYLILSSIFFLFNFSSIKPLISDVVKNTMQLSSADPNGFIFAELLVGILRDVKTLLWVELAFLLAGFFVSLIAQTATILLTAISYKDEKIFSKDLLVRMLQPLTRLFITSFHVALFSIGFAYFGFVTVMSPKLMFYDYTIASEVIFWVLAILVAILYLYLSVVWVLALVVSVLEESCGIEALGKAGWLVKAKRLEGFVLSFLFNLLSVVFFHILKPILFKKSATIQSIVGLFEVCAICLVVVFKLEVYTILYFKCKKHQGEEIELQGSMEYGKIPSVPLVHEDLP